MIGVFSDSHGDLQAFDAAYELLKAKGARRFIFTGGRYSDLDEWLLMRRQKARGGRTYNDSDFLADVSSWLTTQQQVERGPAFGIAGASPARRRTRRTGTRSAIASCAPPSATRCSTATRRSRRRAST